MDTTGVELAVPSFRFYARAKVGEEKLDFVMQWCPVKHFNGVMLTAFHRSQFPPLKSNAWLKTGRECVISALILSGWTQKWRPVTVGEVKAQADRLKVGSSMIAQRLRPTSGTESTKNGNWGRICKLAWQRRQIWQDLQFGLINVSQYWQISTFFLFIEG